MESFAPHQETYWLVQPLLEAGLPLEEVQDLVCRLGFAAVVCDSRTLDSRARELVGDRSADVRAAWVETIGRMIGPPPADPGPAAPPVRPAPPG
ncbi:hypothetical protein [Blastococcus saxobsidens]|uniref:Uncharacterized protein n=1 Tax=Blastococcus saxobsidens TaxID=138336 RepID=A0A4Q7Y5Q3_9ACTN|nr:hypothetical protein [Blastococcus saxobsidens]RZU31968.1 hypothetical protein BKA19_1654 [Blastococcus saxobsidens]